MPEPDAPATTVVVVTWRGREHVGECLDGLAGQGRAHRVLVVDNGSEDGTADVLVEHPSAPRVVRLERNLGYAGALAVALPLVVTPYVAWLNDDAVPEPDWLARLEDALGDAVAAAGSVLLNGDGRTQSIGTRLTAIGYGADRAEGSADGVFGFCGGAVLLRTETLRAVGGVPAHFFCYYEDTDTAWRLRLAGQQVVVVPEARVRHRHGASSTIGSPLFHHWNERNRLLMLIRCAPAGVAVRELLRFAAITAALTIRRPPEPAPNHRVVHRLRVLADVTRLLFAAVRDRRGIAAPAGRGDVWRRWAGR